MSGPTSTRERQNRRLPTARHPTRRWTPGRPRSTEDTAATFVFSSPIRRRSSAHSTARRTRRASSPSRAHRPHRGRAHVQRAGRRRRRRRRPDTGELHLDGRAPGGNTPPATSIDSGPEPLTDSRVATFTFSSELGATFECALDGASFAPCSSPARYAGLGAGSHTFAVCAPTDAAGNQDPTPASHGWTVEPPADTTPPDTSIDGAAGRHDRGGERDIPFSADELGSTFTCALDGPSFEERVHFARHADRPERRRAHVHGSGDRPGRKRRTGGRESHMDDRTRRATRHRRRPCSRPDRRVLPRARAPSSRSRPTSRAPRSSARSTAIRSPPVTHPSTTAASRSATTHSTCGRSTSPGTSTRLRRPSRGPSSLRRRTRRSSMQHRRRTGQPDREHGAQFTFSANPAGQNSSARSTERSSRRAPHRSDMTILRSATTRSWSRASWRQRRRCSTCGRSWLRRRAARA